MSHGLQTPCPSLKVVVARNLGPDVMPLLTQRKDLELVVWPEDRACDREWLLKAIQGATGVLLFLTEKVNAELLDAAGPDLRVVSTMSVGYEHVDMGELASRGIKLGYTPDVLTDAVADVCVMLALMAGRNVGEGISLVEAGRWPLFNWSPFALCGPQISAMPGYPPRIIGFLGFGRIAQTVLARLVPFGVTHFHYSSNPASAPNNARDAVLVERYKLSTLKRVDIDQLAQHSDVVFVLAPGGEKTRHLVNESFLKRMKKSSILVNASRGTLVDSAALALALREGWIWGAGLDVVEGEPDVTADHPLVKEPRCVIVPHIGSATLETRVAMATLAVQNVLAGISNEPLVASVNL